MSKSAQKNTLFNYFGKSPQSTTPSRNSAANSSPSVASPSANTTPKRPALTPSNNETPKLKVKRGFLQTPVPQKEGFEAGSLVWAKLESYPWWPSLVCLHPTKKVAKENGKIHVQFFDDPPTRSWIDRRFVKPYTGSSSFESLGMPKPTDRTWKNGCEEADRALEKSLEERLELVVELLPSDEENSNVEENATPRVSRKKKGKEGPTPKRRRIITGGNSDDDSGDEYKPEGPPSESDEEDSVMDVVEEEEPSAAEEDEEESPVKRKRKLPPAKAKSVTSTPSNLNLKSFSADSPSVSQSTKKKLLDFSCRDAEGMVCDSQDAGSRNFSHLSLDFLKPDKVRDAQRRRPDEPDYDPRTLYVPDSFKNSLTPAMVRFFQSSFPTDYCNRLT